VVAIGGQWLTPDRRGLSELEGFDREVLRNFSQRRNAIEAELERTGRSGPRARHLGRTCPGARGDP
jgi:hypothetical protein